MATPPPPRPTAPPRPPKPPAGPGTGREVATFRFPETGASVRSVLVDGEPWFVARDVAEILGYANPARDCARHTTERQRGLYRIGTPSGEQQVLILNEAGVYRLMMRSNMPSAERFQDWLAEEVVPAIRRTGRYEAAPAVPATFAEALELAARQAREIEAKTQALAEVTPKAEAFDAFQSADGTYSFEQVAKMLHAELGLGRNNLMRALRMAKVLEDSNLPYQQYAHHFHVVAQTFEGSDGRRHTTYTTRVFPSGVEYIRRRLAPGHSRPIAVLPHSTA